MENFDLVIVGGGPGGYVAAIRAAQLGLNVACVEKHHNLGGTCLNVGCIPSKTLLDISHKYHEAKSKFDTIGIEVENLKLNLDKVQQKRKSIIENLTKGIKFLFSKNKVTHVQGTAKIKENQIVQVEQNGKIQEINAKNIIIATGSSVTTLPGIEMNGKNIISSTEALELKQVPQKMLVIGGGIIGIEMASVWSRFGSEVKVVEFMNEICPAMDIQIANDFRRILKKQKIDVKLNSKVVEVKEEKNKLVAIVEDVKKSNQSQIETDVILVAVGRKPNSVNLGLEQLNVNIDQKGFIQVDENFQTNIKGLYAIGDVILGPMLAHKAEEDGIACVERLVGQKTQVHYDLVPSVVYTNPEVAWVGKTKQQLDKENIQYKEGKFNFQANSRAMATSTVDGNVRVYACKITDKLLGCHIVGPEAGNIIHEAVINMEYGGSAEDLARTCHAHPTYNEALKEACLAVDEKQIHS